MLSPPLERVDGNLNPFLSLTRQSLMKCFSPWLKVTDQMEQVFRDLLKNAKECLISMWTRTKLEPFEYLLSWFQLRSARCFDYWFSLWKVGGDVPSPLWWSSPRIDQQSLRRNGRDSNRLVWALSDNDSATGRLFRIGSDSRSDQRDHRWRSLTQHFNSRSLEIWNLIQICISQLENLAHLICR